MKATEISREGWYWFIPGEDTPDEDMREAGPAIVRVWPPEAKPTGWRYTGFTHPLMHDNDYDALKCGGEFVGPLEPPA